MSYQANLSATSTISRLDSTITSLHDLVNQQKVSYSCTNGTTVKTYFEEMSEIEQAFYNFWKQSSLTSTVLEKYCEYTKFSNCAIKRNTKQKDETVFGNLEYKNLWEYPLSNTYTILNERIKKTGYIQNTSEGINKVLVSSNEKPFAFICEYPIALYETNQNCDLEIVGNQFSARPYALGLRKNNPLKQSISETILKYQRELILDNWKVKWWGTRSKCKSQVSSNDSVIRLNAIGGLFIIMIFAIFLALLSLFIDLLNKGVYFTNPSQKQKSLSRTKTDSTQNVLNNSM